MIQLSMMMQSMFEWTFARLERQEGQDFVEYAVILAVVVAVAIGAYVTLGGKIGDWLGSVSTAVSGAMPAS